MNDMKAVLGVLIAAALGAVAGPAAAQDPAAPAKPATQHAPASSSAQIDAGEPRANTAPDPGGNPGPAAAPAPKPRAAQAAAAVKPKGPTAADRVDLGTATVTGDREQPKVMYIVPWKKADIGDLSGKPMNSLLDEALAPVDRDEFKREVAYYDAVSGDTPHNGARPAAAQGEK